MFRIGRVELRLLLVVTIWGANFAVVKALLVALSPEALNLARFTLASAAMAVLLWWRDPGARRLGARDLLPIAALGLLGNTLYQALFIQGIARTSAGNTALLVGLSPLWAALLSASLGLDKLDRRAWTGVALAIAGAALIALEGVSGGRYAGDVLGFLAGVCWASYTVLSGALLRKHPPLRVSGIGMIAGTLAMWATTFHSAAAQDWAALGWPHWAGLAYGSFGALVVCYVLWAKAVQQVGPARTAAFSNLTPVIGLCVCAWTLGEPLTALRLSGAFLALYGVWLTRP